MPRARHQKASDVFNQTDYVFSRKVSFEEAFPDIESVEIHVKEDGYGGGARTYSYPKGQFPGEYIDCRNPSCYNGGFSVGEILREMRRNHQTEYETSKICQGNEGSPRGRRLYRPCINFFKIKVLVKYRENQTETSSQ